MIIKHRTSANANGSRGETSPPETAGENRFLYELAVAGVSLAVAYYSTKLVSALIFGSSAATWVMMTLGGTTMTILPLEIRGQSKSSLKKFALE